MRWLFIGCCLIGNYMQAAVYDCFTFFNELDVLEIRLHELDDVVDYFVLVESVETFKGKPKPLYFLENKARFAKFSDKIIHVVLNQRQRDVSAWEREWYQRSQIAQGLKGCDPEDVVIVSDVDEIPHPCKLRVVIKSLEDDPLGQYGFSQEMCRFYLNTYYEKEYREFPPQWVGSVATSFLRFDLLGAQKLRDQRDKGERIQHGGWHFSSLGGEEKVHYKHESFSHAPGEYWEGTFAELKQELRVRSHWEEMPQFVLDHFDHFQQIGFIRE